MTKNLGELVDINSGYPFRGRIEPSEKGMAFVVQARNISTNGEIAVSDLVFSELPGIKKPDWLQLNDILFLAKGTKNTATLVKDLPKNSLCSPHFFRLRLKAKSNTKALVEFICWQLNQETAQRYFKVSAEGSLQVSIRKTILENTPIVLPDMTTQASIVKLNQCMMQEQKFHQKLIENRKSEMAAIASKLLK